MGVEHRGGAWSQTLDSPLIASSSCPRMNQQLQTKAMALLTALLQGASPTERKVSVPSGEDWGMGGRAGADGYCAPSRDCRMAAHGGG